jgi:hypothetical protein
MQRVVSCKQVIRWVAEKTPPPDMESFPAQAAMSLTALTIWISSDIRHQNPLTSAKPAINTERKVSSKLEPSNPLLLLDIGIIFANPYSEIASNKAMIS